MNQCGFSIGNHNESLFGRDMQTLAKCKEKGITYSAYSPLGGLSGIDVLGNAQVKQVAATHNKNTAQVALRWVVQQGFPVITNTNSSAHMAGDLAIWREVLAQLGHASPPPVTRPGGQPRSP